MKYTDHFNTKAPTQGEKLLGSNQIQNTDGAFVYAVTPETKLMRFLILGSEGGSYYASERKLTKDTALSIIDLIKSNGKYVVDTIVEVSDVGRAAKNTPALFALALAATFGDDITRGYAMSKLPNVARTGTHLFQFMDMLTELRGNGRAVTRGLANWYLSKSADDIIFQYFKYQQRGIRMNHRNLLRIGRPKEANDHQRAVFEYIVRPTEENLKKLQAIYPDNFRANQLVAINQIHKLEEAKAITAIKTWKLPFEVVPKELLTKTKTWEALLPDMPMTTLIRNLGKMSQVGLLKEMTSEAKFVVAKLTNQEQLQKARIHPLTLLSALKIYQQGKGDKGSLTWTPVRSIIDALDEAFYLAFKNIEPTGKNILIALDVSDSMTWNTLAGVKGITPREGSAVMSLITAKTEKNYLTVGFSGGWGASGSITPIDISPKMRLDTVLDRIRRVPAGSTNCALPMLYAEQNKIPVDAFVVYTDSETNSYGSLQPAAALKRYRQVTGIPAKLIVVGMEMNDFTIADPTDPGMMDVVGFDTNAPAVMSDFIRG